MKELILVVLGGATGSGLRWWIGTRAWFEGSFPVKTLLVNLVATGILGFLMVYLSRYQTIGKEMRLLIGVGFCGGLSTFSTFSLESFELLRAGNWGEAVLYPTLSFGLCLGVLVLLSRL